MLPSAVDADDERSVVRRLADRVLDRRPRRRAARLIERPDPRRLGVCCSGGGIRSASYNLGALQVLTEQGELEKATYLTAVSGGAYLAGARAIVETQTAQRTGPDVAQQPFGRGSPEEDWLRNHSDYIAPGTLGKLRLLGQFLVGFATNLLLVGAFLYVIARPLGWVYQRFLFDGLPWKGPNPFRTILPWMWRTAALPAAAAAVAGWLSVVFRPRRDVSRIVLRLIQKVGLFLAVVAFVSLILLPYLTLLLRHGYDDLPAVLRSLMRASPTGKDTAVPRGVPALLWPMIAALAMATVRSLLARKRAKVALFVAMVIGPAALVLTFVWFLSGGGALSRPGPLAAWLAALVGFAIFYGVADLTNWSGHPFYKKRLATAYATYRTSPSKVEPVPYQDLLLLSRSQPAHWPQLILCGAANLSDPGLVPPRRGGSSFTFSYDEIGGPLVGAVRTSDFERVLGPRARDMTVLASMAVSGAAISPSMGKMTIRPLRFLFALTGISLGVWLPNPSKFKKWRSRSGGHLRKLDRPRPSYLARELFGLNSVNSKYLYITDGGHYENLGLVELLRRGCTQIYCFDASGDQDTTFYTLGEAIAIAREDVGVDISLDPTSMQPPKEDETGRVLCAADHKVGRFRYEDGTEGILVYVKAAVTPDSPYETLAYRQRNPVFPHDPTFDQLFDDEKFEAYWSLGRYGATGAVDAMRRARAKESWPDPAVPPQPPPGTGAAPTAEASSAPVTSGATA